jgi:hypothetical protein
VIVDATEPECVGYSGQGWRVPYHVTNSGAARPVVLLAKVDDADPVAVRPQFTLGKGARVVGEAIVDPAFAGEGLMLILTDPNGVPIMSSFPVGLEECPSSPADQRQAGQVTTTT